MRSAPATVTGLVLLLSGPAPVRGGMILPQGFQSEDVVTGLERPVDMVFAPDGRIFVAEKSGVVRVIENDAIRPEPFIDLRDEVNGQGDRGMLGLTLDPDFAGNRRVYLLYVVDPLFGPPDESNTTATFGRLTCYTGTAESNGNVADPDSRCILVGAQEAEGFPVCWVSHAVGSVQFGLDGSLFASAGDGAQLAVADPGGITPECFGPKGFGKDEDVGAFRAQYLGSLAGKVLRLDPATGEGLPSNPHWTGVGTDKPSKVWVNGLRNPFQLTVRPGTGPGPGTLYIGDVGWTAWEEINVARGGENFGWPCRDAFVENRDYPDEMPAHSGCDSIGTKSNPGPLTDPIIAVSHTIPSASVPPGTTGRCIIGGAFYEGASYPPPYQSAYFYADYINGWVLAAEVDAQDALVAVHGFGSGLNRPTDLEASPLTGDLHVLTHLEGRIQRVVYTGTCFGDIDGDGTVGFGDLLEILGNWGPCKGCPQDVDHDGTVAFGDILVVLAGWGVCDP